jgi:type I restriction enzyme S subunit
MELTSLISNAPWLCTMPPDWRVDRLKDIVPRILGGGTPSSSDPDCWEDGDIVWVTPTDFSRSEDRAEIFNSERKITRKGLNSSAATLLPKGTVIMASRATIGTVRLAGTELATNQGFISLICDEKMLHCRFLYYVISGILGEYFAEIAPGTTFQEISRGKARLEPISFPSLPEQQRIAAYLDASCVAIDAAVAAKRRQLDTLDTLRESITHKAVTCGLSDVVELKDSGVEWLGKMPVHWQIKRIKDIVDLKSGNAITSDSITPIGNYPVFGGNGLRGYTNSYTHDGYYVLIGRQGALCGNINYAEGKFWASEHAVVALTLKKHDTFWLGELLRVMNLNQYSNAAAQPGLAVEKIKFLRIPIPPYEEQIRIASWLKNTNIKNEKIVSILRKQISTLTAYRKSLIHECVTGQRRITEADVAQAHRGRGAK